MVARLGRANAGQSISRFGPQRPRPRQECRLDSHRQAMRGVELGTQRAGIRFGVQVRPSFSKDGDEAVIEQPGTPARFSERAAIVFGSRSRAQNAGRDHGGADVGQVTITPAQRCPAFGVISRICDGGSEDAATPFADAILIAVEGTADAGPESSRPIKGRFGGEVGFNRRLVQSDKAWRVSRESCQGRNTKAIKKFIKIAIKNRRAVEMRTRIIQNSMR
jgi:hypothetical protein